MYCKVSSKILYITSTSNNLSPEKLEYEFFLAIAGHQGVTDQPLDMWDWSFSNQLHSDCTFSLATSGYQVVTLQFLHLFDRGFTGELCQDSLTHGHQNGHNVKLKGLKCKPRGMPWVRQVWEHVRLVPSASYRLYITLTDSINISNAGR